MAYRILNFVEAMSLAEIVSKYVTPESLKDMTGEEFAYFIFSEMEIEEIEKVSKLLLGDDIIKIAPSEIIIRCVEGMIKNELLHMLDAYGKIGFIK